jgi:hypothetical protein
MECTEAKAGFGDWTRGAAMPERVRTHLEFCPDCAAEWRQERELTAALVGLRAQYAGRSASLAVKEAVLQALPTAPARQPGWKWRPLLALAATLIVAIATGWYMTRPKPVVRLARQPDAATVYTDFFPLSAVALERHEPAQVVRIRLPRREMRRFGFPVSEEWERYSIEADVLIGQDGVARAVRFVSQVQ